MNNPWKEERLARKLGHPCPECAKEFSSTHQLSQHQRIHSGEKPYKCTFCDKSFKQLSHLQQHTRLHTGERPYKCPMDCGRAFIQLSNLNQHMKTHANSSLSTSNLVCSLCCRVFKTESSLISHKCKATSPSSSSSSSRSSNGSTAVSTNQPVPSMGQYMGENNNHQSYLMGPIITIPINSAMVPKSMQNVHATSNQHLSHNRH